MDNLSESSRQPEEDQKRSEGLLLLRSSKREPPNMSVKRIVLLGSHRDVKASCGNIILGRKVFSETPASLQLFESHEGLMLKRNLMVINTPDLLNSALSPKEQDMRTFFHLACPGPHALLLVLKPGTLSKQERDALKIINSIFGAGASEYVIIVFIHNDQTEYVSIKDSEAVESLLQTCKRPHHDLKRKGDQSQVQKLLENIEKMLEDNGGHHLSFPEESSPAGGKDSVDQKTNKLFQGAGSSFRRRACSMNPQQNPAISRFRKKTEKPRPLVRSSSIASTNKGLECVRIVLIGKTGVGKSATGNTILGRDVFESRARMTSVTRKCQRESGVVCRRPVTVVDTPGLFDTNLTNDEIQQEIMRCVELSASGPHVFLLVIAVGPFTQEERKTLELIKMTFGQKAQTYTIVAFTRGDNLGDEGIKDYIQEGDSHVQKLIHDCGGRYHVFNNKEKNTAQVVSLLKKIDLMMWNNDASFYDDEMFREAERAIRLAQLNKEREEDFRQEIEALKAKYECEIKEYKEKLEEEKAKLKIRDLLLTETENTLLKKHQITEGGATADTEQTQAQNKSQENPFSGKPGLGRKRIETVQGATEKEAHLENKKHIKKWGLGKWRKSKQWGKNEMIKESNEEEIVTDQQISKDTDTLNQEKTLMKPGDQTDPKKDEENIHLPRKTEDERNTKKEKLLLQQIDECRQKLEEAMRNYREISEMNVAELKKIQERNAENIGRWEKKHGMSCVLQ